MPRTAASWASRSAYVGRRGDDRRAEVDDLSHARLGRLRAAGDVEHADLLHRVVQPPEADERPVAERDVGGVGRPHAAAPDRVRPHLGDPRPVLARVERPQRSAARSSPTSCGLRIAPSRTDRRELPVRRRSPPASPSTGRASASAGDGDRQMSAAATARIPPPRTGADTRGCGPQPTRTGSAALPAGAPRAARAQASPSSDSSTGSRRPPLYLPIISDIAPRFYVEYLQGEE